MCKVIVFESLMCAGLLEEISNRFRNHIRNATVIYMGENESQERKRMIGTSLFLVDQKKSYLEVLLDHVVEICDLVF